MNPTYRLNSTNLHSIHRNYNPLKQVYRLCPLTNNFKLEDSRPIIIPHEYIQPFEITLLEKMHNFKFDQKLYNRIQANYELSPVNKEVNVISGLELFCHSFALKT